MDKEEFKKVLDLYTEWRMTLHSTYTALKSGSTSAVRRNKATARKMPEPIDDFELDEENIDDSDTNAARHKESLYPVVFRHKPIKTTCNLCNSDVFSQVLDYKFKGRSCVRKCSICKKTDEIKVEKNKRNK